MNHRTRLGDIMSTFVQLGERLFKRLGSLVLALGIAEPLGNLRDLSPGHDAFFGTESFCSLFKIGREARVGLPC